MDPVERAAKAAAQTETLYAAIGRFVVKFEQTCETMRQALLWTLHHQGLTNQRVVQAILAPLTAGQLVDTFGAVLFEAHHARQDAEYFGRVLGAIRSRALALVHVRNDVIHRTWWIGWASAEQEDFSVANGIRFVRSGRGVRFKPLDWTVGDFDAQSREADLVTALLHELTGSITTGVALADRIVFDSKGELRFTPQTRRDSAGRHTNQPQDS